MAEGKPGKSKWTLDLDVKQFLSNATAAKRGVDDIGNTKSLTNLTEKLMSATRLIGIVGAAALAVKGTFAAVFASEDAKSLNDQFVVLAKNAGLAGEALKEKLVGATGGLVDDKDAIRSANEQIIKLGSNAAKLPEIMELARKHTAAFGGDMIQKFEQLSFAISTGQTRGLRSLGIILDQDKAYKEYAKSIGKTVDMLSQEERQRAILEATLKKGESSLKGINEQNREATLGWQKLLVTLDNLKDTVVETFGRVMGPTVTRMISNMNVLADSTGRWLKKHFGTEAEQASEKLDEVQGKIYQLQEALEEAKEKRASGGFFDRIFGGSPQQIQTRIDQLKKQRDELMKLAGPVEGDTTKPPPEPPPPEEDLDAIKEQKNRFHKDLLAMKEARLKSEMDMSTAFINEEGKISYEADYYVWAQKNLLREQTAQKIRAIMEDDKLLEDQKSQKIVEIEAEAARKRLELEEGLKAAREKNLDKYLKDSSSVSEGITRAFQVGAEKNRKALTDWGATGNLVFGSFQKQSTKALLAWGEGTMSAGEAVKSAMFGVVADTAEAKGQEMMLAGIWPPNPGAIAGGAGLIALAGFLRGKAGGGSSSLGGGAGGGGAGSTDKESPTAPEVKELPKKAVSINIQGSYFETEQTQRRLVELIRQESDATDFSFRRIGS